MAATMVVDAEIYIGDVFDRLRVIPSTMDVRCDVKIAIHWSKNCVVYPDSIAEAVEFLNMAVTEERERRQRSESPPAVDAVDPQGDSNTGTPSTRVTNVNREGEP